MFSAKRALSRSVLFRLLGCFLLHSWAPVRFFTSNSYFPYHFISVNIDFCGTDFSHCFTSLLPVAIASLLVLTVSGLLFSLFPSLISIYFLVSPPFFHYTFSGLNFPLRLCTLEGLSSSFCTELSFFHYSLYYSYSVQVYYYSTSFSCQCVSSGFKCLPTYVYN